MTKPGEQVERLKLQEDMTIYEAVAQKQQLLDALARANTLELDLSDVGNIDSAGFQLLALVKREATRQGKAAPIVAHSAAVSELLDFYNVVAQFGDPLLLGGHQKTE